MTTSKLLLIPALVAFATSSAFAGGEGWTHDWEAAKKMAAEQKKDLLVDFTGSDWCGWCIKLNKEVFSHDPFKSGVADKFILVEIDFPRDKSKLSEETQKQNADLQKQFSIRGFPTILLMDAEGRPYAQTGYQAGGPEAYVSHLDELQAGRVTRDAAFAEAEKLEGVDKAKALAKGLSGINEDLVAVHYKGVIDQITTLDPEDESGYGAKLSFKSAMTTLQNDVMTAMRAGEMDGVPAKVDAFIEEHKLEGAQLQSVLGFKMDPYLRSGKLDEADKVLDAIIAAGAETTDGKRAASFKPRLEKMKADQAEKSKKPDAAPAPKGE